MSIISENVCNLKKDFVKLYKGNRHIQELLPLAKTDFLPIPDDHLASLSKFIQSNPIYDNTFEMNISEIKYDIHEGDLNEYWLNSIKHDTSYAPFYPTWLLSAYVLAAKAKEFGFSHLVDIGSGDGRIAYCGQTVGIESTSIEIDSELINLQNDIIQNSKTCFNTINTDATQINYDDLKFTHPIFFIGGVPQNGEILADSIIKNVLNSSSIETCCFVLTGTLTKEKFSKDQSNFGWGVTVKKFNLNEIETIVLPTYWTMDQPFETPYLFTKYT